MRVSIFGVTAALIMTFLVFAVEPILPQVQDGISELMLFSAIGSFIGSFWLVSRATSDLMWSGIRTLIRPAYCFLAFYGLIFFLPYLLDWLGFIDLTINEFGVRDYFDHSNRALCLATFGVIAFAIGFSARAGQESRYTVHNPPDPSYTRVVFWFGLLGLVSSVVLVYLTGANQVLDGPYTGLGAGSATLDGVYFLSVHFAMLVVAVSLTASRFQQERSLLPMFAFAAAILWALKILSSGDRNNFLLIVFVALSWFSCYAFRLRLIPLLVIGLLSWMLYQAVEVSRMQADRSLQSVLQHFVTESGSGIGRSVGESSLMLTTITSRAAFTDDASVSGRFSGYFKLVGLMGVIPFSRQLLPVPQDGHYTSAQYLSEVILGPNSSWSIGSNIMSDLALDLGAVGFVLMMATIGLALRGLQEWASNTASLSAMVVYPISLSLVLQWPRYSFDFPVRNIAWTVLVLWAARLILKRPERRYL